MARGARSNKGKALRRIRREKVEGSTAYKAAEQKRFELIQKSLEQAAASKKEEAATRALTEPAAMEGMEEVARVAGADAAAAGPSREEATGADDMDVQQGTGRSKRGKLAVKVKGLKQRVRKGNPALHGEFHVRPKKGRKLKRQWLTE